MSRAKASVDSVLEPIRDAYLSQFYDELSASKERRRALQTETIRRDPDGTVMRDGVLNLPSRFDFTWDANSDDASKDVSSSSNVKFGPVEVKLDDSMTIKILPFSWDRLHLSFESGDDAKRLLRLRLWFLEWFQPRYLERDNLLQGVLHSLSGPTLQGGNWHVCIDMGTAPSIAFVELLKVLESRGVERVALGAELDRVPSGEF